MSAALDIVARMLAGWQRSAKNGVWHDMPRARIFLREAVRGATARFVTGIAGGASRIDPRSGMAGVVMNDDMSCKDDRTILDLSVMGVFEIEDGLIVKWRESFSSTSMHG